MTDPRDHGRYADRDGAYVLGALSAADRREFESHLETCDRCRRAVAEVSGLPGLLGRVGAERAFSLLQDDAPDVAAPPPPADLVARIETAERARRRTVRWRIAGGVAAAAVVVGAVAVPVGIAVQPHPTVAVALTAAEPSPLSADVALTSVAWGTRIDMRCGYRTGGGSGVWGYELWVVGTDGTASQVSTWKASSGSQVGLSATTALSLGQIAEVEVRSSDTGDVLLSKRL